MIFSPGQYRTGMVRLKSHVTIDLLNQANWTALADLSLYPKLRVNSRPAFLFAEDAEDLHITGHGTIYGSGERHDVFIAAPGNQRKSPRPYGILLWRCRNVSVTGVTLKNSAFWMLRPDQCDDVMIRGVKIHNHSHFNNDGIDIVDCHRVVISDCILDCEDDAICLKSEAPRGVENVTVSNCIISSHASAIKFGTASYGTFNIIAVSNCVITPSGVRETLHPHQLLDGIAGIDLASTDGARLTNASFNNIVMDGVLTPLFIRLGNRGSVYRNAPEDNARTGSVDNVTLANIHAVNAGAVCSSITGCPGHYVTNVRLSNIDLSFKGGGTAKDLSSEVPENSNRYPFSLMFGVNLPSCGLYLRHVKDISIDGLMVRPPGEEVRPELVADDVHGLQIPRFKTGHPGRAKPRWEISRSTDIEINNSSVR